MAPGVRDRWAWRGWLGLHVTASRPARHLACKECFFEHAAGVDLRHCNRDTRPGSIEALLSGPLRKPLPILPDLLSIQCIKTSIKKINK